MKKGSAFWNIIWIKWYIFLLLFDQPCFLSIRVTSTVAQSVLGFVDIKTQFLNVLTCWFDVTLKVIYGLDYDPDDSSMWSLFFIMLKVKFPWMWCVTLNVIKMLVLDVNFWTWMSGMHLLNAMYDLQCDGDACWIWLFTCLECKCGCWMWSLSLNVVKFEFLNFAPFGFP